MSYQLLFDELIMKTGIISTKWFIIIFAYSVYKTRNFEREIDYF